MKYTVVNIINLIKEIGETEAKSVLSDFKCPLAPDVEEFFSSQYLIQLLRHIK